MKINGSVLIACCLCLTGFASFSQTPANDNFANATVLSGTDLTFSGNLANATVENTRETVTFSNLFGAALNQSVWWKWTAPVSTTLNLQLLSSSTYAPFISRPAGLFVYSATNGSPSPAGLVLPPVGFANIGAVFPFQTVSIPVIAGSNYFIQLIGSNSPAFSFRLAATNTPLIVRQPRSQAVFSNAATMFYVAAAGANASAFTYQWRLGANNLPGETAPILGLTNVNSAMAGVYSVVVSNAAGFTVSQPATLTVSQSNVPVFLGVVGSISNTFVFTLTGENGRFYRIESSTNLSNWMPESIFPREYRTFGFTSVVFNTNSPLTIATTENVSHEFFRASPYLIINDPHTVICLNNLEQITIAKFLWQGALNASPTATPGVADIIPFLPRHLAPFCPDDPAMAFISSYSMGDLFTPPSCNIHPLIHFVEAAQ